MPQTFTDAEFRSILATRYGVSESYIRTLILAAGKFEPRMVPTSKGFGLRIGWTHGDMANIRRYFKEYILANPHSHLAKMEQKANKKGQK